MPVWWATMVKGVAAATITALETGTCEAATLAEILAVDLRRLWVNVFPEWAPVADDIPDQVGITKQMVAIATLIHQQSGLTRLADLSTHPCDLVRGWAAYLIGFHLNAPLPDTLRHIQSLAADPHFGVREWAWLAVRHQIAADIQQAIHLLSPWVSHPSPRMRRFAVESTRPRGVWSPHIPELKTTPELGLPLLDPLMTESERYVQDSVANWLNDASKTQPAWVQTQCQQWLVQSAQPSTQYITQRATRSLQG